MGICVAHCSINGVTSEKMRIHNIVGAESVHVSIDPMDEEIYAVDLYECICLSTNNMWEAI